MVIQAVWLHFLQHENERKNKEKRKQKNNDACETKLKLNSIPALHRPL